MKAAAVFLTALFLTLSVPTQAQAAVYHVGPAQNLHAIAEVPWDSLQPGDEVNIHWRSEPYREKWVICRRGEAGRPIVVRGIAGPNGQRPVISGDAATTPAGLNFWNEPRGLLKIGGANHPADTTPAYIIVEGLHFMSARPGYFFTNDGGDSEEYVNNAAAVYVEKAEHLILRDCAISDSGNGLFIGVNGGLTKDILIEGNHIYDNGIEDSYYEHNSYTSALGIIFQFNHYGPLRAGCGGNNLKDRSAGLVVRYNWIENGNRQLDLVDGEDSASVVDDSDYHRTMVYGNILIEADGEGNAQMVHYGGDSGDTGIYRKGTLFFFNNTVVSTRSGNTTLLRLSTNDESAFVFNNIIYSSADGAYLAMLGRSGQLTLQQNWIKRGWVDSHESDADFNGQVINNGGNIEAVSADFVDAVAQDFRLQQGAAAINAAMPLPDSLSADYAVQMQYVPHLGQTARADDGQPDLGAFEYCAGDCAAGDAGTRPDVADSDDAVYDATSDAGVADSANADAGIADSSLDDDRRVAVPDASLQVQDANAASADASSSLGRERGCACTADANVSSVNYKYLILFIFLLFLRKQKNRRLAQ